MIADPQDAISEITEINGNNLWCHAAALLRSVGWGALAGGGPYMIFSVPITTVTLTPGDFPLFAYMAFMPVLFAGGITLVAALILGLPLTWLLHRSDEESVQLYLMLGVLVGCTIPAATLLIAGGPWEVALFFTPAGIFAGGATAFSWGRWRTRCTSEERCDDGDNRRHPNPFHEMIH